MTSRAQADATSDADLLRAHADGDPQAFAELVRRHRDRLWAVALRTIGDREEAADAVQDALLAAHRNAARFRGESAVTTWLHRIVVNACLDRIRRRQAHPTVPLPDGSRFDDRPSGAEPAAPVQDHDTALVVREALAALPPDQRAAIVLVDVQGYPVAEAAEILGVAEGTIKSRCARGRARMAITLGHLRGSVTAEPGDSPPARRAGSAAEPRDNPVAGRAGGAAGPRDNPVAGQGGGAAEPDNSGTPAAPKRRGLPQGGVSPAVARRGGVAAGRQEADSPAVSKRDGIAAEPEDNESAAESRRGGIAGGPKDSGNSAALSGRGPVSGSKDDDVPSGPIGDGAPARTAGGGSAASGARDTGHEAGGNQSGARSVPSGPAAASGPRPGTHERRDQR